MRLNRVKIIIISCFTLWSSMAFAGSEPTQIVSLDQYKCGESEYGDRVLKIGESCEASTYFDPYLIANHAHINFWLEYRPVAKRNFRRFKQTRIVKSNRDNPYYPFRFPFKGTGEYRVQFDVNNNGYPDYTTNSIWIYEKE